jgi:hypothetical protein
MRYPNLRRTRFAMYVAYIFFVIAVILSPGPGSSIGMPWPLFLLTWGIMFFASLVTFTGYFVCLSRGELVSVFYLICPLLFMGVCLAFLYRDDIARVVLSLL